MPLRLEKMANEVTHQRLRAALSVRPPLVAAAQAVPPLLPPCHRAAGAAAGAGCRCPARAALALASPAAPCRPADCLPAPAPTADTPHPQSLGGEGQRGLAAPLVDVMFGRRPPGFASTPPAWTPLNGGLDESQQRAVSLALAAADVALIHGGLVGWAGGWASLGRNSACAR